VYQLTPLAVVVEVSATEVTSTMHVEIMADVVTSTHETNSMSVQTLDATTSQAMVGAVVLTTTVRSSSASKTIVPSMTHVTSRLDLSKALPSHLPSQALDSNSQGSHDSHRGNSHLTQRVRRPLDPNYLPVHTSFLID
jgi:hypothetical protein